MGKILVIDDEKVLVDIISEILIEDGYTVKSTTDPVEAIKLINEDSFDLVITDLKMPNIDGLEITNAVKNKSKGTEVIVITGYGSLESAVEALKKNVYDYILKPFNVIDISRTVKRVFEKLELESLNRELKAKIEKNLNDITTLYEISKVISSTSDIDKVLDFTMDTIHESIGMEKFSIMIYDKNIKRFVIKRAVGLSENTKENFSFELNEGIIGGSMDLNDIIFVNDFKSDENYIKYVDVEDKKNFTSFVLIPLVVSDEVFGIITVHSVEKENSEDLDKLNLLSVISTQISPLLKLYIYQDEQNNIFSDPLFRVKKEMESIVNKAAVYKGGLIFIIFKLYLKKYGEKETNIIDISQKVLNKLRESISIIDSVIVLGIESFVVILQGRSQVIAETFALDIKKEIEREIIPENSGFILDHGYATFPIEGITAEELIGKAQNNLWKSIKSI